MSDLEVERLVVFCRELRADGVSVTPAEAVTAASALQVIDTNDREEVFLSLRSILTTSVDDFPIFAEVFRRFWNRKHSLNTSTAVRVKTSSPRQTSKGLGFFLEHWGSSFSAAAQPIKVPGASDTESITTKDFSEFTHEELEEVSRLARRMVRRLARRPSRRWRPVRRGHRVNLRRSLRLSLKTGGELIELTYKERRPKRTKLVVLCDVSGSMDIYSRLLLQFVYGLQNSFAKVESFVFATSLARITGELKNKTYKSALDR
ncbi:MAG TPA: VWA domain-containing protein, partial [Pyrinomonadaceae bacterium]